MFIKQLEMDPYDNFSYLVGCDQTRQGMVIDPGPKVDTILAAAEKAGIEITTIFNTHAHGDHTAGNGPLKALTGARIIIHEADAAGYPRADQFLTGETSLTLGTLTFTVIHTPGHTPGCVCLYAEGNLFTGDTLFVGDSGRTDLRGGDRPALGASIRRLMQLPDETVVWPGHDYGPTPSSTLGWEKRHNVNAREYGYFTA